MYLTKEQTLDIIENAGTSIKSDIESKTDFLYKIFQDDDWSIIIKSHALIESLITDLIVERVSSELKPIIERIPLHEEQIGKIKILKIYELVSSEQLNFIKKMSELRNNLVHKFENIDFTFEAYLKKLDKNQKKKLGKLFVLVQHKSR